MKEDRLSQLIQKENLVKGETYIIDVQTRVNPEAFQAIWSEWSPTTKLVTEGGFLGKHDNSHHITFRQ